MEVFGELKSAQLEKLSSDPVTNLVSGRVYFNTTLNEPRVYNGSLWGSLGGSSGAGELNLVESASVATGWTETGTVFNGSPTTTSTSGDLPLEGIIDTAIQMTSSTSSGSESTNYVSYAFTTPASLSSKLKVEFYMRPGSNFIANEWTVSVYQSTTRQPLSTDVSSVTYIPSQAGKFTTTFDCLPSTAYTIRFARTANAGTNAGILNIANVIVGPGIQPQGAVVGRWRSTTLTWGGGAPARSAESAFYRQVGTSMEIRARFVASGAGTSSAISAAIPDSLTFDSTALTDTVGNVGNLGDAQFYDNGTTMKGLTITYATTTTFGFTKNGEARDSIDGDEFASGDEFAFHAMIPIAEWVGSATVSLAQNDVEYASVGGTWDADSTTTVAGASGTLMGGALTTTRLKTITWPTSVQATDRIMLWASKDQVNWFPINGAQLGSSNDPVIPSVNAAGTTVSGVAWRPGSSANQTIVVFGRYLNLANDDSPAVDWPSSAAYWVATKAKTGQVIGFGNATATSAGLASPTGNLLNAHISASAAIDGTKVNLATSSVQGVVPSYQATTATTTSVGASTGSASSTLMRIGDRVFLGLKFNLTKDGTTSSIVLSNAIIPSAYRPAAPQIVSALIDLNGTSTPVGIWLNTAGTITLFGSTGLGSVAASATYATRGTGTYFINVSYDAVAT